MLFGCLASVVSFTQAVEMYTRALDMDPDNHLALSNRSAAFLKINERGKVGSLAGLSCLDLAFYLKGG
jgi:hypothetical protein